MNRTVVNVCFLLLILLLGMAGLYVQQSTEGDPYELPSENNDPYELPSENNDSVVMLSASPKDVTLEPGDKVTFRYSIGYTFESAERGSLSLSVQADGYGPDPLPLGFVQQAIDTGSGTVDLEITTVVPDGKSVAAIVAILAEGRMSTRTSDTVLYEVGRP